MSLFLLAACGGATIDVGDAIRFAPVDEIVLDDVFDPIAIATDSDGLLYAIDKGRAAVGVFDIVDGHATRLSDLGKEGDGPGEFRKPTALAVSETYVAVVSEYLVSIFDKASRTFVNSFRTDALDMKRHVTILSDSIVVVGGYAVAGDGPPTSEFLGEVAHFYTVDGRRLGTAFEHSRLAASNAGMLVGAYLAPGVKSSVWVVQPGEYRVANITSDGTILHVLEPTPINHSPMSSTMPKRSGGSAAPDFSKIEEWYSTWDMMSGIFAIDDTTLLLQRFRLSHVGQADYPQKIDLLDTRSGEVIAQGVTDRRIRYFDPYTRLYYFLEPIRDGEPVVFSRWRMVR